MDNDTFKWVREDAAAELKPGKAANSLTLSSRDSLHVSKLYAKSGTCLENFWKAFSGKDKGMYLLNTPRCPLKRACGYRSQIHIFYKLLNFV